MVLRAQAPRLLPERASGPHFQETGAISSTRPFASGRADCAHSCYAYRQHTWALRLFGEAKSGEPTDDTSTTCSPERITPLAFGGRRPSRLGDVPRPL